MKLLVLVLLLSIAALAQKVTIEFDQSVDFRNYRTFAIRDGQLNSRNPVLNSELVKKQIDAELAKEKK